MSETIYKLCPCCNCIIGGFLEYTIDGYKCSKCGGIIPFKNWTTSNNSEFKEYRTSNDATGGNPNEII